MGGGKRLWPLSVLLLALCAALWGIRAGGGAVPAAEYDTMVQAAQRFEAACGYVRGLRGDMGLALDVEDRMGIGLMGSELTAITTTLGDPAAKRTAQTPDMAALCVRLLCEAGVKPGDRVGACMSGSFPGLNIALVCACEVMGAELVYTASVGASSYGANLPELTSPELLLALCEAGILHTPPVSISAGGDNDSGVNMLGHILEEEALIQSTLERVQGRGVPFVCHPELADNVAYHAGLYGDIDCFVNVGGTVVGSGSNLVILGLGQGLLEGDGVTYQEGSGLLEYYLAQGVPSIHLLNIKQLCLAYGIPFDPAAVPETGRSGVYFEKSYPRWAVALTGLLAVSALAVYGWKKQKHKEGMMG